METLIPGGMKFQTVLRVVQAPRIRQTVRPEGPQPCPPGQEVGDLQGERRAVSVLLPHQVANLVVDADAEAPVNGELLEQPLHGHEHEVQVVHRGALHHPVHTAGHELGGKAGTAEKGQTTTSSLPGRRRHRSPACPEAPVSPFQGWVAVPPRGQHRVPGPG